MDKLFIFKNCLSAKGPHINMHMKYARARDLHSFNLEMPPSIAWSTRKPKNIMACIGWASGGTIQKQCNTQIHCEFAPIDSDSDQQFRVFKYGSDETEITWENWMPGEPNNWENGNENCVMANFK